MLYKIIFFFTLITLLSKNAYAYFDPGVGSIIIQGIIATIAATSLTIKIYWYKIKSFFKKRIKPKTIKRFSILPIISI